MINKQVKVFSYPKISISPTLRPNLKSVVQQWMSFPLFKSTFFYDIDFYMHPMLRDSLFSNCSIFPFFAEDGMVGCAQIQIGLFYSSSASFFSATNSINHSCLSWRHCKNYIRLCVSVCAKQHRKGNLDKNSFWYSAWTLSVPSFP